MGRQDFSLSMRTNKIIGQIESEVFGLESGYFGHRSQVKTRCVLATLY